MKTFGKNLSIKIKEQINESPISEQMKPLYPDQPYSAATSDLQEDRHKAEQHDNLNNVIQFEQFLVEDQEKVQYRKSQISFVDIQSSEPIRDGKHRKQFTIQIPQNNTCKIQAQPSTKATKNMDYRQPPAPSNKHSIKSKNFVFPIHNEVKEQIQKSNTDQDVEELVRSFDRQRQQFYRQKSKLERQLLVKEGQIQLLQKMLTGHIFKESSSTTPNYHYQSQNIQSILLKKDLQISQLLDKLSDVNRQLQFRGEELKQIRTENNKLLLQNQNLANRIYVFQNKQLNNITTQQFYDQQHRMKSSLAPKSHQFNQLKKDDQISYLQRRLQTLSQNRKELEDRNKIKSEMSFTQSSKYKPSTFDFRNQCFDKNRTHKF